MFSEDKGDHVRVHHRVGFADCDPARIAYTGRLVDFAIASVDEFWRGALKGPGWFEMQADHRIGTPFVKLDVSFSSPVTPRAPRVIEVRVAARGHSSISYDPVALHDGRPAFTARFVNVIVEMVHLKSCRPPDWIIAALARFLPEGAETQDPG